MNKIHLTYISVIVVLVALLTLSLNRNEKVEVIEKCVTDTLFITRVDTVVEYKTKVVNSVIVDTLYIESENTILKLPIEQKHFSTNNLYDAWVSGYKPNLDSIKVYPKTIYKNITREVTKEVVVERFNLYTYFGFKRFHKEWLPSVGLMAKSPKNSIYGVEIGLDNDNDLFWAINIGYKLK